MPVWWNTPKVRSLTVGTLLACFSILFVGPTAFAQSSTVTADIPAGIVEVQGKTSPNAQIKIYENGNELPSASIVADVNGFFTEELPQDSTGVVDIGVRAIDTDGRQSVLITKQVAIIYQQTSTLTVILPPTITVTPATAVFKKRDIEF